MAQCVNVIIIIFDLIKKFMRNLNLNEDTKLV